MRAMAEFLRNRPDLEWIVIRPGRLVDGDTGQPYRKEPEKPSRRYTTRVDLAKVILDGLETGADIHEPMAVTSRRETRAIPRLLLDQDLTRLVGAAAPCVERTSVRRLGRGWTSRESPRSGGSAAPRRSARRDRSRSIPGFA